jgi:predicted RNA-binding protein with PIN domain
MQPEAPPLDPQRARPGSEVIRAIATIAAFVAIAVGYVAIARQLGAVDSAPAPYSSRAVPLDPTASRPQPSLWLVDGFNLLHAAVLRSGDSRKDWWKSANRERVVELARGFDDREAELVVVFDGSEEPREPVDGGPSVVFAAPADDWLLAKVKASPNPHRVAVVTADRRLADRLRDRGAQVVSPSAFAARCRSEGERGKRPDTATL